MALPQSVNYLATNGIVTFDVDSYLNMPMNGCNPCMLGGATMPMQPAKDTFASKAKSKLSDKNFLKTVAAVGISALLIGVGIFKGKKIVSAVKDSNFAKSIGTAFSSVKAAVMNFFAKSKNV